jgi:hypothetical protein
VERTYWRVQDAAGAARAAEQSATGPAERFLKVKQRELAAHQALILAVKDKPRGPSRRRDDPGA